MIALLGDIHAGFDTLRRAEQEAVNLGAKALIQVGDFGWYWKYLGELRQTKRLLPVYFIDGNHENHEDLFSRVTGDITEFWESNLFYVRRGSVLEIDGKRIAFLGGAASIDKAYRLAHGIHWSAQELVTDADVERLKDVGKVDLFVTHTPPQSVVTRNFETPEGIAFKVGAFGVPPDWSDPSAAKVETAWNYVGLPPLVCGHFHKSVIDGKVTILNIAEFAIFG
jgi:hypothetical protein